MPFLSTYKLLANRHSEGPDHLATANSFLTPPLGRQLNRQSFQLLREVTLLITWPNKCQCVNNHISQLFLSRQEEPVEGGNRNPHSYTSPEGMGNRGLLLCGNVKKQKDSPSFPAMISFNKLQFFFRGEIITGKTKYLSRNIEICLRREL